MSIVTFTKHEDDTRYGIENDPLPVATQVSSVDRCFMSAPNFISLGIGVIRRIFLTAAEGLTCCTRCQGWEYHLLPIHVKTVERRYSSIPLTDLSAVDSMRRTE